MERFQGKRQLIRFLGLISLPTAVIGSWIVTYTCYLPDSRYLSAHSGAVGSSPPVQAISHDLWALTLFLALAAIALVIVLTPTQDDVTLGEPSWRHAFLIAIVVVLLFAVEDIATMIVVARRLIEQGGAFALTFAWPPKQYSDCFALISCSLAIATFPKMQHPFLGVRKQALFAFLSTLAAMFLFMRHPVVGFLTYATVRGTDWILFALPCFLLVVACALFLSVELEERKVTARIAQGA